MRKRFWILASLLALSVLAAATAAALCEVRQPETADIPPSEETGYILTGVNGEIGVFRDGELILRTGVDLGSLRAGDRARVEEGIRSESYEEILMLLEDFGA